MNMFLVESPSDRRIVLHDDPGENVSLFEPVSVFRFGASTFHGISITSGPDVRVRQR